MNFSQQIYDNIYAAAQFGADLGAIAVQLDIPMDQFMEYFYDPELKVKRYYDAGRLKATQEINNSILSLAKNGSQVAQLQFRKIQMAQDYETLRISLDEL